MKTALFAVTLFLAPTFLASDSPVGTKQIAYKLDYTCFSEIKVPVQVRASPSFRELEYISPNESVKGLFFDLNKDGKTDLLVQSSRSECGTGGCLYSLYLGPQYGFVGLIFGEPIFMSQQTINGYPILYTYSHSSATSGTWACYVYDKQKYSLVDDVYVSENSLETLAERWLSIPLGCEPKDKSR